MPDKSRIPRSESRKINGYQKAAILMVAIGEEAASEIMRNLSQEEVEKITREISSLRNVPSETIKEVVNEYYKLWQARDYISEGGFDYAEQVLRKAMGEKQAKSILRKLGFLESEPLDGFQRLDDVNNDQLVTFLQKEHPQTIALILSRMDPQKAAAVLEKFPEDLQVEIVHRIAILGEVSSDFIFGVEDYLESHFKDNYNKNKEEAEGQKIVANILNLVGKSTEKSVLNGLAEIDQGIAAEIKNLMFVFDDLIHVDDRSIQKILKEIDAKVLSVALKGASEETKEKIFKNMSERAAGMLKEEMEYLGPVRVKEVEEAQRNIMAIVAELEERGEVIIYREGSEDEIIV